MQGEMSREELGLTDEQYLERVKAERDRDAALAAGLYARIEELTANRWAAFTDDELEIIGFAPNFDGTAVGKAFRSEYLAELKRRRS